MCNARIMSLQADDVFLLDFYMDRNSTKFVEICCSDCAGRTVAPYLLGKRYLGNQANSPGQTFSIGLRPISRQGLGEVRTKTKCMDGQVLLEALGFSEVHLSFGLCDRKCFMSFFL
jgi:hypothetical protein